MFANKYIEELKPYPLVTHKVWELNEKQEVLKLDWNESTIPPSPKVKENILKFLDDGKLHWYPDVDNSLLMEELLKYNKIPSGYLQYFASSDSLHEYIIRAFAFPGDKISIIAPTYDNFRAVVESAGGIVNFYYSDKNFHLDVEHFKSYLELQSPKIVYICNPNNPTGSIYNKEVLEQIISEFQHILFIIDEAYYEFTNISCKDLVIKFENIIITRTFSKAFALASFRIGYAISSRSNIALLSKIRNPKNISSLSQIAAISVLKDIEYMQNYVQQVKMAKTFFDSELKKLGFVTIGEGGNFSLIKINLSIKKEFISSLELDNIYVRDYGHVKGLENFLRITIGTKDQMKKVIECIKALNFHSL